MAKLRFHVRIKGNFTTTNRSATIQTGRSQREKAVDKRETELRNYEKERVAEERTGERATETMPM